MAIRQRNLLSDERYEAEQAKARKAVAVYENQLRDEAQSDDPVVAHRAANILRRRRVTRKGKA